MICPYCGKENPDDIQLCNFCGGSLVLPVVEKTTEPQPIETPVRVTPIPAQPQVYQTSTSQPPPKTPGGIYGNKIWWIVGCGVLILLILGCGAAAWGLYRFIGQLSILHPATLTPTVPATPTSTILPKTIPSVAPSLPPQPVITVTANPIQPTNHLIFSDDFSDPGSGWDRIDQNDYYADYFENEYRIIVYSNMSDSWANPDDHIFGDVAIEVDATKNGGPDDNDFGVICRYQSVNQFYYAVISSDGYFGITKVTSVSSSLLGRDSLEYSDAIHQGFTPNHIRFNCNGDVLTLYVNGQQVDQQTDSEYTNGNVGLIAGTYDVAGTDILFDNFAVYQP